MKNIIILITFLTSGFVSAQTNFGVGIEHFVVTYKTPGIETTEQVKLMPRFSYGYNLKVSTILSVEPSLVTNMDMTRTHLSVRTDISDDVKAHVGLNLNIANGNISSGMHGGLLFNEHYLVEYVNTGDLRKNEAMTGVIAIGVNFGF